jgi:hypothetical protein
MEGFKRPIATVLPDSSLVPPKKAIWPPPNKFTHELTRRQPFFFSYEGPATSPNGQFEVGDKVVLIAHDFGDMAQVITSHGLYVETSFEGLRAYK